MERERQAHGGPRSGAARRSRPTPRVAHPRVPPGPSASARILQALTPAAFSVLQRTAGNQAALRLLATRGDAAPAGRAPATAAASSSPPTADVVQRQLVPGPTGTYYVDNRDAGRRQRFTKRGAFVGPTGEYDDQDGYGYRYDDATRQLEVLGGAPDQYWDTVN